MSALATPDLGGNHLAFSLPAASHPASGQVCGIGWQCAFIGARVLTE
jgi:hypothetical protein